MHVNQIMKQPRSLLLQRLKGSETTPANPHLLHSGCSQRCWSESRACFHNSIMQTHVGSGAVPIHLAAERVEDLGRGGGADDKHVGLALSIAPAELHHQPLPGILRPATPRPH